MSTIVSHEEIGMKNMHEALRPVKYNKMPYCAVCMAQGEKVKATSRELAACNDKKHVLIMRRVFRSVRAMLKK